MPNMSPNRKRIRHRTKHPRKSFEITVPTYQSPLSLFTNNILSHDARMEFSDQHSNFCMNRPMSSTQAESAKSRDRRIFGGDGDETQSALELRGPMLDIVLGLFNGIDYDDALC